MRESLRLDQELVRRGLAASRTSAQRLIAGGGVNVGGLTAAKPSLQVTPETPIEVSTPPKYVSRGGDKLEGALEDLYITPEGLILLDVGASTGGFTDCLLQHGARRVIAVDVGHGQLANRLRGDARVISLENLHARDITQERIGVPVDAAVIDVSFISLTLVLGTVYRVLKPEGWCLALIKPQFECGPAALDKRGIVRDEAQRAFAVQKVKDHAATLGYDIAGTAPSHLPGGDGNREVFVLLCKKLSNPSG